MQLQNKLPSSLACIFLCSLLTHGNFSHADSKLSLENKPIITQKANAFLRKAQVDDEVIGIRETSFGWYELSLKNNPLQVIYVRYDGEFIMVGDIYSSDSGHDTTNLTEATRREKRRLVYQEVLNWPEDQLISYVAEEQKAEIWVFTDPYCPFCRRLHAELDNLLDEGISLHYIPFPVIREDSYPDSVKIWCAEDRQESMHQAKIGGGILPATIKQDCQRQVQEGLELGQKIGIRGTPHIVLENLQVIDGYVSANELALRLGL